MNIFVYLAKKSERIDSYFQIERLQMLTIHAHIRNSKSLDILRFSAAQIVLVVRVAFVSNHSKYFSIILMTFCGMGLRLTCWCV